MKFLKEKKVIILLTGRYAGKKAVIIRNHDDGTPNRKYGHAEVLVLTKEPRKVIRKSSQKTQAKRSYMKTTIKTVNYQHMMPTRYTLDVDLRTLFSNDVLAERKRQKETCQEATKQLTEKFKSGKNKWFFAKLRF